MITPDMRKKWTLALLLFLVAPSANAYIDPGTGSLLIQGLIAAIAGALVTFKFYWHRILTFLGFRRDTGLEDEDHDDNSKEE